MCSERRGKVLREGVIFLEIKCSRSSVGVSGMDKVRNQDLCRHSWNRKVVGEQSGSEY